MRLNHENSTDRVVRSDICLRAQLLYCFHVKQDSGPHHRKERTQRFADSHKEGVVAGTKKKLRRPQLFVSLS